MRSLEQKAVLVLFMSRLNHIEALVDLIWLVHELLTTGYLLLSAYTPNTTYVLLR